MTCDTYLLTYLPTHVFLPYRAVQNTTNGAAELFGDGQLDWIYLDATHTYAEARNDLERWYPKVLSKYVSQSSSQPSQPARQ